MKAKKLSPKEIALLAVAAGFAWSKLGLGAAVSEIAPELTNPCPEGYVMYKGSCTLKRHVTG